MARYRRRYRTIVRAPKKKWATNIYRFNQPATGTTTAQFAIIPLVQNAAQSSSPTPVIVKTGNFKIQGDVSSAVSAAGPVDISVYVMYMPEGVAPTDAGGIQNLINAHPEWVMAWKFISGNSAVVAGLENHETYTFSSRLKRNLNSGDRIQLLCLANSSNQILTTVRFTGLAQYWTCAN